MRGKRTAFCLLFLLFALLLSACGMGAEDRALPDGEGFCCGTLDHQGEWVLGFQTDQAGQWCLAVPSAQSVRGSELYVNADVVKTSAGQLDPEGRRITGAFSQSGDTVHLTLADGTECAVTVLQSDLPSVQIYLNDTTLEEIHKDKTARFEQNTLVLTTPDGTGDLLAKNSVQIKGRGNSTWTLSDKKGYQVEFPVQTSVLDMPAAKKWILLANAFDDSMIRSQLVYRLAEKMDMPFVTSFAYVDLWIDGDYLGTYLIGEKVEIEDSRLDLKQPDGAIFEHDEGFYMEEDHWFYSDWGQRHFSLKDIGEKSQNLETIAMENFETALNEFAKYMYTTPSDVVTLSALSEMIDVESFAKYYLINEYVLNRESFVSSFYWYQDGKEDVIHLGPVWDFDSCMGNDGTDYTEKYGRNHIIFHYLLACPEFYTYTQDLYRQYETAFSSMCADADALSEEIRVSAQMNYLRWDTLGKQSAKSPTVYFQDTFADAVTSVKTWLAKRSECFAIEKTAAVTSSVSEDGSKLDMYFSDGKVHTDVQFAVRNVGSDMDMVVWFPGIQVDGVWRCTADLSWYHFKGIYYTDVYADGMKMVGTGCNYVPIATEPEYPMDIQISNDGEMMQIAMKGPDLQTEVFFNVWSEANGGDDLQHLAAVPKGNGEWTASASMKEFKDAGKFYVHAYEMDNGMPYLRNVKVFLVEHLPVP